ncbi:MAG: Holliday junction branch migration protein RuvA [bacterium]|nr:Holliday junction branch migration protein RuvA [Candidatus Kapabacteria bacterium]
MISYLHGTLLEKSPTYLVVVCGGVGYGVMISLATYEQLPAIGNEASLHTQLVVREDALTLYGFAHVEEREMFQLLTTVTGVGPKIAIGILSAAGIDTLKENIARGNSAALTVLPGIGKKTAERISLELRDKISATGSHGARTTTGTKADARSEALAAMLALGYTRITAEKAIRNALKEGSDVEDTVERLLKSALKHSAE